MKYGLSDKQIEEIVKIIDTYKEVEKALVFGSRATGRYKNGSDVDIAIFGEKADTGLASKIKFYLEEETYLPYFFDVIAYNSLQSEELKKHIDTYGKVLYKRR